MKCFDRAAEKCYSDTLNSAVSSCSWGKHVALGTGSAFQILWDKKQVCHFVQFIRTVKTLNFYIAIL